MKAFINSSSAPSFHTAMSETRMVEKNAVQIRETLRLGAVFSEWQDADILQLVARARLRTHPRGSKVLWPGADDLIVVASGCVELSCMNSDGAKFVKALLRRGDCSGVIRLLRHRQSNYDYIAHEDCTVVHLPCCAFVKVLDAQPALWRSVALYALQKHQDNIAAIQHRALSNVLESLASVLVKLMESMEQSVGTRNASSVYLSQNELGTMLGISRQTINKELRKLANQGAVRIDYGRVDVLNMEALRALANRRTDV